MYENEMIKTPIVKLSYLRVSSDHQDLARQVAGMKEWFPEIPEECIFTDKASGGNYDRVGIQTLLKHIKMLNKQGIRVELYIHEYTRLGRNYDETREILNEFEKMDIVIYCPEFDVFFKDMPEELRNSPYGKMMMHNTRNMFIAFADIELRNSKKRRQEGYALYSQKCLEQGIKRGRPAKSYDKDLFRFYYARYMKGEITAEAIIDGMGISKNKFYRILKEEGLATKSK